MVPPDRVTREEAATVFRRAAELEATDAGVNAAALIDAETLIGIARDAGLSPASVEVALDELRSGALGETSPTVDIVRSEVVRGDRREVSLAVEDAAQRNLLLPSRRQNATTVWVRRRGFGTALRRGLGGRERYPLIVLKELRTTVTEQQAEPGLVRVRLEGQLVFPWRMLPLSTKVLMVGAIGGGAVVLAVVLPDPGMEVDDGISTAGAVLASVGATGRGLRAYRESATFAEHAFELFMDAVRHAHPLSFAPAAELI